MTFNDFKARSKDTTIVELDYLSQVIPYSERFYPASYKNVTDFQINKKEGIYDVEAMRIIHLFFTAFNINNNKIGKEVMRRAERNNQVPGKIEGSILTTLNKLLVTEIFRKMRLSLTINSNDAKVC